MPHRSTNAVAVIVAVALGLAVGCASDKQEQQQQGMTTSSNLAATRPAAVATAPPAPAARPAPPAPKPPPAPAAKPAPAAPAAPPAPPAPAAAPTTGRTYTIKPGDSLWKISKEVYGDATKYEQIQKANPTLDPQLLKPGTVIVIP